MVYYALFRIFPDFSSSSTKREPFSHDRELNLAWAKKKSERNSSGVFRARLTLRRRSVRQARAILSRARARMHGYHPHGNAFIYAGLKLASAQDPERQYENWSVHQPQIRLLIRVPRPYRVISHLFFFYKTRRKRSGSFEIFDFERNRAVDPFPIFFGQEFVRFTAGIYEQRNHKGRRKNIILPFDSQPAIFITLLYTVVLKTIFSWRTFVRVLLGISE